MHRLRDNAATWLVALFVPLLALVPVATPARSAEISVSVDEGNPPYMYRRDGYPDGIYAAIVAAAFTRMKMPLNLYAKPWARVLQDLDRGAAGAMGLYKTGARTSRYDFSDPIVDETVLLYFNRSRPLTFRTRNDLRGLTVGVLRGWSYGEAFDNAVRDGEFRVEEVASDKQNFRKLESGRLDAILATKDSGNVLMSHFRNIEVAAEPLARNPTFLAFSKHANQLATLQRFNKALREMRASGELDQIVQRELKDWEYQD